MHDNLLMYSWNISHTAHKIAFPHQHPVDEHLKQMVMSNYHNPFNPGYIFVCVLLFSFFLHCFHPRYKPSHKRKQANEPAMPLVGHAILGPQTTYVQFFRFYLIIKFNSAFSLASTFLLVLLPGQVLLTFHRKMR